MYRHKPSAVCRTTLIILVVSLIFGPVVARAQDGLRYWASGGSSGPIGSIWSSGQVRMNGRLVGGAQPVWSGDLLEAVSGASNQVFIASVGQVSLMSNARVRLSLGATGDDEQAARPLLVAALLDGDLALRLNEDAVAYVEAGGQGFVSSAGAVFRIGIRDGRPFVEVERGTVEAAPESFSFILTAGQPSFIDRKTKSVKIARNRITTKRNQPEELIWQFQRMERPGTRHLVLVSSWLGSLNISQAQNAWEPAVGQPVAFHLTNPIGTLNGQTDQIVLTDASGTARVTFVGQSNGDTTVIGRVILRPGDTCSPEEVHWEIRVGGGFFTGKKLIIIGAVAAAATYPIWHHPKKIKQLPPPVIIP